MSGDKIIQGLEEAVAGEHARETNIEVNREVYLGDGVYASHDGYQICLRAPRGFDNDYVYLDPIVLAQFLEWLKAQGIRK